MDVAITVSSLAYFHPTGSASDDFYQKYLMLILRQYEKVIPAKHFVVPGLDKNNFALIFVVWVMKHKKTRGCNLTHIYA